MGKFSKFSKFKEIFSVVAPIAKPFVPGAAGTVLDAVTKGMAANPQSPPSPASADAIKQLAADNDEQTQAILVLHDRIKVLEKRAGL